MEIEKFKLLPDSKGTENKTIRFPLELIEDINNELEGKDTSFSSFVIQACKYALNNKETSI